MCSLQPPLSLAPRMQYRPTFKKGRTQEADWRHPVDEIEPEAEPTTDSALVVSRILRHLSSLRGMGAVKLGDETAAIAAVAVPEAFPGGYRQPMLGIGHEDKDAIERMQELWDWLCMFGRRPRLSAIGHRTLAAIYVLRPDLLDGQPLEVLGEGSGITRQALSKLVSQFRDCFGGVRNRTMKSDETRARCRSAKREHRVL